MSLHALGFLAANCLRSCPAGSSYKPVPTEVVPTVVLPPTPPTPAHTAEQSEPSSSKAAALPSLSKLQPAAPAAAAAAGPGASAEAAAEALISDYGFSKTLAPAAVEEYTGRYRYASWSDAVHG
jgi:hypothetical protein